MSDPETAVLEPEVATEPQEEQIDLEEYRLMKKLARRAREFDHELGELSSRVAGARSYVDQCKAELKAAKATLELVLDRQQRAIADRHQEKLPGFAGKRGDEAPAGEAPPASDDAWKDRPIRELELSPGILTKLEEMGIDTIGKLEHLRGQQDPDYPRGLNSVKGFGEAKITLIEDAVTNWLDRNRDNLHALAAEQASPEPMNELHGEVSEEVNAAEEEAEPDGEVPDGDDEVLQMGEPVEVATPPVKAAGRKR